MENLNTYFENSNLLPSEKDKALTLVKKLEDGSYYTDDNDIHLKCEGIEELFYIISNTNSKNDFYFLRSAGWSFIESLYDDREYSWFNSQVYLELSKISNYTFEVQNWLLEDKGEIKDEDGNGLGLNRRVLSFDYNQKKYIKEMSDDSDFIESIFGFINNFIQINNVDERRFYMTQLKVVQGRDPYIFFVKPEQIQIMKEYVKRIH
ncbi:MAG: hypothetical protein QE277_00575 [Flectobacillus sp.]|nr:hypothetical protein [Flectobacillus sp.]